MMEAHIWTHLAGRPLGTLEIFGAVHSCAELNAIAFAAWRTLTHRALCRKLVLVVARWRRWF